MSLSRVARRLALATLLVAVGASAVATSGFGQLASEQPLTANRFVITLDGFHIASFQQLIGITLEAETPGYWETSGDSVTHAPDKYKPPTVVLKRAMTDSMELWAWHDAVKTGTAGAARKNVSLTAFDNDGKPVAKWFLENAWPSKLEAGTLKSDTTKSTDTKSTMAETVTLTADHVQRVSP